MNIQSGTDVFDSGGEKVGTVGRVFSGEPVDGPAAADATNEASAPPGPAPSDSIAAGAPGTSSVQPAGTAMPYQGTDRSAAAGDGPGGGMGGGLGPIPVPAVEAAATGSAPGEQSGISLTPSDTKFFEVKGGGILGMGGHTWYVPFSAVAEVAPEAITLSCSRDECADRYSDQPASLAEEVPSS